MSKAVKKANSLRCLVADIVHLVSPGKRGVEKEAKVLVFANLLDSFPRESNGKGNGLHAFPLQDQKSSFLNVPSQ